MTPKKHGKSSSKQARDAGLQQENTVGSAIRQCYPSEYSVELGARLGDLASNAAAMEPMEIMSHEFDAIVIDQWDSYRIVAIYYNRATTASPIDQQLQVIFERQGIYTQWNSSRSLSTLETISL